MKTFEEKWTAWLDDELTGKELVEFESSLPDRAAAEAEKGAAKKLGVLLKQELGANALANAEFFSHQLSEEIARTEAAEESGGFGWFGRRDHDDAPGFWTLPRLFLTGAAAIALFLVFAMVAVRDNRAPDQSQYLSQILNTKLDPAVSPNATVSIFESQEDRVTVLWTEGLQSLPAEYAAK
jgi:hypothetical protein